MLAIVSQVAKLPKIEWHFSPLWLILSFVALIVFQGIHAETWRRILHDLHGDIPRRKAWAIWNVSLLARYVPTQVLLAVTRVTMSEREGVPKRITIASIAYEFALVTAGSIVVAAWGLTQLPALRTTAGATSSSSCRSRPSPASTRRSSPTSRRGFCTGSAPTRCPARSRSAPSCASPACYAISFIVAGIGTLAMARALTPSTPPTSR